MQQRQKHRLISFRQFPQMFPVVTGILLLQTAVYFFFLFTGRTNNPEVWANWGAVVNWRIDEGEFWRLLFSLFLHVNFFQFLMIAFSIYLFSPQLERLFGKSIFLFIFLVTGIMGNLGVYLMDFQGIYTGAAEAVYGIMGVYLYLYLRGIVHPLLGKSVWIFVTVLLLLGYPFLFAHVLSVITGFVLAMIMLQIKQIIIRKQ
ncbi:MAG: rhomboid family intramembrane serine protease [Thermoactinomyces sp.]